MFILIVGGGKVGTYLARDLLAENHEVVVIEKDAKKAQFMTNLLEQDVANRGDGCDPVVLTQAGVSRADVVVADTGDDEDNLVVSLIAQKNSKARSSRTSTIRATKPSSTRLARTETRSRSSHRPS